MSKNTINLRPSRRRILTVVVCAVALYVVVPQFGDFSANWHLIRHPDGRWVMAALGLTLATYGAAAGTYCLLAVARLSFGRTLIVQLAAMFINRLLPAGVGALGTNYAYLRHYRHSLSSAASIVALNNALGFVGHALLLALALLFSSSQTLSAITQPTPSAAGALKVGGGLLCIAMIAIFLWGRPRLRQFMADLTEHLLSYRHRPAALIGALLTSMLLTLCNVLCLLCCLLALNIHLSFIMILLIFSFGVGAGIATPTPGGLGGFEAGLAAGLVLYHVDSKVAIAAALLYRLVSYWFPLIVGSVALGISQRHKWLEARV